MTIFSSTAFPKRVCLFLLLVFLLSFAYAQNDAVWHRTDDLVFKLAVCGPGAEVVIWWGHIVLIVENTRTNISRVFDWGVLDYPGDNFLTEFINGRVQYMCEASYLDMDFYLGLGLDITVYTLNLDRTAKETMLSFIENNILPENSYYEYNQFHDNCSSRIRDVLDLGIGGQLKAAADIVPGRLSIRQHIRRYTWFRPVPADWFADFLMGQDLDQKITAWDEMFLPAEIARNIKDFSYIDSGGTKRPLVSSIEVFNVSEESPAIWEKAPITWPFTLCIGLVLAAVFFYMKVLAKKFPRTSRIFLGISQSLLGLFFGACGCVLFFGLFIMKDDYIRQNINILFINPLLLLIAPLGIMSAINRPARIFPEKCLRIAWTCVFITCCLSVLAWILPGFYQQNQSEVFLMLPVAFSHLFLTKDTKRPRTPRGN